MLGFAPSRDLGYGAPRPVLALVSQPKWGVPPSPSAAAPQQAGLEQSGACEMCCEQDSSLIPALVREEKSFFLWFSRCFGIRGFPDATSVSELSTREHAQQEL